MEDDDGDGLALVDLFADETQETSSTDITVHGGGGGFANSAVMTADERKRLRKQRAAKTQTKPSSTAHTASSNDTDERFVSLITKNEDDLLSFVAQVNKLYEQKLKVRGRKGRGLLLT